MDYIQTDLAWAAGIFEGEGNFFREKREYGSRGKKSVVMQLRVYQTSFNDNPPEMLMRFKTIFNCGHIYFERPKTGKWKPKYRYSVHGREARQVLELIWPYLGNVKKEQACKVGFKLSWE